MKTKPLLLSIIRVIAMAIIILPACNFATSFTEAASTPTLPSTSTSTSPPLPTNTPIPTEAPTEIPTDTPPPPPPPTKEPAPTTEVPPTNTPGLAQVKIVNNLTRALKIKLRGPSAKTVTVQASSEHTFTIAPGDYSYTLSASGYVDQTGSISFKPGDNTWTIGKAR